MNIYPSLVQVQKEAGQGKRLIPLGAQLPSDTLTPVSAFLRLRASGSTQAFLLESAEGGEDVGRYSVPAPPDEENGSRTEKKEGKEGDAHHQSTGGYHKTGEQDVESAYDQ